MSSKKIFFGVCSLQTHSSDQFGLNRSKLCEDQYFPTYLDLSASSIYTYLNTTKKRED